MDESEELCEIRAMIEEFQQSLLPTIAGMEARLKAVEARLPTV